MEVYGTRGPTADYNIAKFGTNAGTAKIVFDGTGNVGIDYATPSAFYYKGLSVGDGGSGDKGITIYGSGWGALAFADGTSGDARYEGYVAYNQSSNQMLLATAHTTALTLGADQSATFAGDVQISGTTPTLFIGDDGAEDTRLQFLGNVLDIHIGVDDSNDKFTIGKGSTLGTTTFITIDENGLVTLPDNYLSVLGRIGIGVASATCLLDLRGSTTPATRLFAVGTDSTATTFSINSAGTNAGTYSGNTTAVCNIGSAVSGNLEVSLKTKGSCHLGIVNGSKVGINTETPANDFVISDAGNNGMEFGAGGSTSTLDVFNRHTNSYTPFSITTSAFTVDLQGGKTVFQADSTGYTFDITNANGTGAEGMRIIFSAYAPNNTSKDFLSLQDSGGSKGRWYSNGDIYTTSGTDIQALSDERLKDNIANYTDGLEVINSLQPRTYTWKDGFGDGKSGTRYGFIAQEIKASNKVTDSMNLHSSIPVREDDGNKYDEVIDDGIIFGTQLSAKEAILISAIKKLSAKVEALELLY